MAVTIGVLLVSVVGMTVFIAHSELEGPPKWKKAPLPSLPVTCVRVRAYPPSPQRTHAHEPYRRNT